jgi:hypothetical protein
MPGEVEEEIVAGLKIFHQSSELAQDSGFGCFSVGERNDAIRWKVPVPDQDVVEDGQIVRRSGQFGNQARLINARAGQQRIVGRGKSAGEAEREDCEARGTL